jgi:phosphatidylinositol alpha-1,6-mannosyltransferase
MASREQNPRRFRVTIACGGGRTMDFPWLAEAGSLAASRLANDRRAGEGNREDRVPETVTAGRLPRSLFITQDFPPRIGGAQSYYWGMIRTLRPEEVVVLAPAHPQAAAFDAAQPYTIVRSSMPILWPTAGLRRQAEELIARHRVDLVQLGHPLPAGLLGPALRRRTGRPYLVFLGGAEVTLPAALPGLSALLRRVLGGASLLVAVSGFTAAAARRVVRGRVPAEVVRPALPIDELEPPGDDEIAAARDALGVRGPLIVCVGRLVPRKGQDRLVEALGTLTNEFPLAELALIGDGRLAGALRARAARLGIADRVRLLGALPQGELRRWLAAADVFASPCRDRWGGLEVEGYGLVFAEAALMGLPVIAGRSGGAPEAVRDGDTGIVVDGASPAAVAEALRRLLRMSEEERRAMGRRGRELALSRHAPEVAGERYRHLLADMGGR